MLASMGYRVSPAPCRTPMETMRMPSKNWNTAAVKARGAPRASTAGSSLKTAKITPRAATRPNPSSRA